jgi:ribonuclease HII
MKQEKKWIIGIDEVGRGALAGPVVVAAALMPAHSVVIPSSAGNLEKKISRFSKILGTSSARNNKPLLRDSKRLSPKQREAWFAYFKMTPAVDFSVARVYPRRIEKMNISRAANLAAFRACKRLMADRDLRVANVSIFLDGGLFLGQGAQPKNAKTVIKGDEKIPAIAIASIIAKVHRDRFMVRLSKKYPAYGFERHKGYGTKAHYKALRQYGSSDVHRRTFL